VREAGLIPPVVERIRDSGSAPARDLAAWLVGAELVDRTRYLVVPGGPQEFPGCADSYSNNRADPI